MIFAIVYVLSVLISGAGAIWLLFTELAADRRRIKKNCEPKVTWLKIFGGTVGVFIPIFNTIISLLIISSLLDRPVITKRN